MGNQGHSWDDARTAVEYVWAGAIGDVREVHVWTNRPLGYWPQGIPRPEPLRAGRPDRSTPLERPGRSTRGSPTAMAGNYPTPDGAARGTCSSASRRTSTYHPIYHPFNWRGWVDWGQGALGDMGAHLIDHPIWALDLGMPDNDRNVSTPFNGVCYPERDDDVSTSSPARGNKPPVKLTWYDGGLLPPKPVEIGGRASAERRPAARCSSAARASCCTTPTAGIRGCCRESLHKSFGTPTRSCRASRTRTTR